MKFFGYGYHSESFTPSPVKLQCSKAVVRFIKDHYEAPQLVITDGGDNQLLLMRDGVDPYNALDQFGI